MPSNTRGMLLTVCVEDTCMHMSMCAQQLHRAPGTALCRLGLLNPQLISGEWKESSQMAVNVQKKSAAWDMSIEV